MAESHTSACQFFDVGRLVKVALGVWYIRMHLNGGAIPALIIGENKDDVRFRGREILLGCQKEDYYTQKCSFEQACPVHAFLT